MARYLLDTNLLRPALTPGNALALWIEAHPGEITLSAVTVREALRGMLASIAEAESPQAAGKSSLSTRYALLVRLLEGIQSFPLHPYSEVADALYQSWPKSLHRTGPNDCRIAASAIVAGLIVLTHNTTDFSRIAQHDNRLRFEQEPA
nr:type II toxin-antitoxin system VapC family toxin [Armatimonas sp.]